MKCPECNSEMILKNSRYGKFYSCINWPKCKGSHGAHPNGLPLGIPADAETKKLRIEAHKLFDKLWENSNMTRTQAYQKLQNLMNMTKEEAHIGKFNKEQCLKMIEILNRKGK
jgi:ssDNA-binding Zn-finger/Zn-ribbon topoisomerase 1